MVTTGNNIQKLLKKNKLWKKSLALRLFMNRGGCTLVLARKEKERQMHMQQVPASHSFSFVVLPLSEFHGTLFSLSYPVPFQPKHCYFHVARLVAYEEATQT